MTSDIKGGGLGDLEESFANECARPGVEVCSIKSDIEKMKKFLVTSGITNPPTDKVEIIEAVKGKLGVKTEAEIYTHSDFLDKSNIEYEHAKKILETVFKPTGPAEGTQLLDNYNIDNTLHQWQLIAPTSFGKKFYHIPFQMIDFDRTGTELSKLDLVKLIKQGYDCFGVILNTDVSSGRGIHWFCLYGDLKADPVKLEYFNSSGYPPRPEVETWLERKIIELKQAGIKAETIYSTGGRQIQYSKTECGVWSLVYILSRLTDHPYDWMITVGANDDDMINFRSNLFRA